MRIVTVILWTGIVSSASAYVLLPLRSAVSRSHVYHNTPAPITRFGPHRIGGSSRLHPLPHWMISSSFSDTTDHNAVRVERLDDSAVQVYIPVPGFATRAAYDKICAELSRQLTIPGFRRGSKLPPHVLEQNLSRKGTSGKIALRAKAIQELLTQLVEPTLKQQALEPLGQATLAGSVEELAQQFTPGEPMVLPVRCDVWPEIHWKKIPGQDRPYVGLTGQYSRRPFNQVKLNTALRDLQQRYATNEPIDNNPDYALQWEDACTVNMEGYLANSDGSKGEPLPSAASGDNVEIILGTGRYMTGLVEGLVGAKVGETKTVSVSFPKNLRDKTLAGKQAVFDVTILQAFKRIVPELTDEFAKNVRADLTAESLSKELQKAVDQDDAKEFLPARNKALSDALAQVMEVQVPDTLVTNQARERFAVMMADMRDNGVADDVIKQQITPENFQKYKAIVKDEIVRDFKVSMATDEIARLENIQVPDYQVQEQLEAIKKDAAQQQSTEKLDENMLRAKVETTLQRQAVMEWLAERANLEVEYKDETFDEKLMQKLAEESLEREKKMAEGQAIIEAKVETKVNDKAVPEPTPATEDKNNDDEETRAARYASMSLEERAFQILKDTGALQKDDDDDEFDE